jgi:hypothetical protein
MHARELVELAAILSSGGPIIVRTCPRLSTNGIQQYWTAAKCRLDRWARGLKAFTADAQQANPTALRVQWPGVRSLLEEILTGEVLTRVWTTVLCLCDRRNGTQEAEAMGRSIMIGHLEARHRVLMLLVHGPGIDAEAAVKLNYLRRRTERWVDVLVGHLGSLGDVGEFAIDAERAKEFGEDLQYRGADAGSRQVWPLLLGSVRAAFQPGLAPISPNSDLNATIASSILSCLPADLFDSTGLFRSVWLTRLTNVTDDMEGMIENLLRPEAPRHAISDSGTHPRRFGGR